MPRISWFAGPGRTIAAVSTDDRSRTPEAAGTMSALAHQWSCNDTTRLRRRATGGRGGRRRRSRSRSRSPRREMMSVRRRNDRIRSSRSISRKRGTAGHGLMEGAITTFSSLSHIPAQADWLWAQSKPVQSKPTHTLRHIAPVHWRRSISGQTLRPLCTGRGGSGASGQSGGPQHLLPARVQRCVGSAACCVLRRCQSPRGPADTAMRCSIEEAHSTGHRATGRNNKRTAGRDKIVAGGSHSLA